MGRRRGGRSRRGGREDGEEEGADGGDESDGWLSPRNIEDEAGVASWFAVSTRGGERKGKEGGRFGL